MRKFLSNRYSLNRTCCDTPFASPWRGHRIPSCGITPLQLWMIEMPVPGERCLYNSTSRYLSRSEGIRILQEVEPARRYTHLSTRFGRTASHIMSRGILRKNQSSSGMSLSSTRSSSTKSSETTVERRNVTKKSKKKRGDSMHRDSGKQNRDKQSNTTSEDTQRRCERQNAQYEQAVYAEIDALLKREASKARRRAESERLYVEMARRNLEKAIHRAELAAAKQRQAEQVALVCMVPVKGGAASEKTLNAQLPENRNDKLVDLRNALGRSARLELREEVEDLAAISGANTSENIVSSQDDNNADGSSDTVAEVARCVSFKDTSARVVFDDTGSPIVTTDMVPLRQRESYNPRYRYNPRLLPRRSHNRYRGGYRMTTRESMMRYGMMRLVDSFERFMVENAYDDEADSYSLYSYNPSFDQGGLPEVRSMASSAVGPTVRSTILPSRSESSDDDSSGSNQSPPLIKSSFTNMSGKGGSDCSSVISASSSSSQKSAAADSIAVSVFESLASISAMSSASSTGTNLSDKSAQRRIIEAMKESQAISGPKYYVATLNGKGQAKVLHEAMPEEGIVPENCDAVAATDPDQIRAVAEERGFEVLEYRLLPRIGGEDREKKKATTVEASVMAKSPEVKSKSKPKPKSKSSLFRRKSSRKKSQEEVETTASLSRRASYESEQSKNSGSSGSSAASGLYGASSSITSSSNLSITAAERTASAEFDNDLVEGCSTDCTMDSSASQVAQEKAGCCRTVVPMAAVGGCAGLIVYIMLL